MIDKHYRENALKTYGESCEICGHRTSLEVHHINYQEQQQMEQMLRFAYKYKDPQYKEMLSEAKSKGFVEFNNNQLAKDDSTTNLSVLCGNCHSLIHTIDVGMKLLKAIKPRK
jgi:hypothetical protein